MVTEIRQALRDTADLTAVDAFALADVVAAGSRRVRRRRIITAVGAAGLTVAAAFGAASLTIDGDRAETPLLADLTLDDAKPLSLDVLGTRVAPWEVPDDAEGVAAVTEDGFVVQGRGRFRNGTFQLGLLDPAGSSTTWLPALPGPLNQLSAVDLSAERLVYLDWHGPRQLAILSFDRDTETWSRAPVEVPQGQVGRFFGAFTPGLGPDGRVYLLDTEEGQHWWSVPTTGGPIKSEPSLEGSWIAWSGSLLASGHTSGRITVSRDGQPLAEIHGPPDTCTMAAAIPSQAIPPLLRFAGSRLVAHFQCRDGNQVVVYDDAGQVELTLALTEDLWVEAAGDTHVVLSDTRRIYLLDLETHELSVIDDTEPRESPDADLGAGLVLWDVAEWNPEREAWDTVHKVARLPSR